MENDPITIKQTNNLDANTNLTDEAGRMGAGETTSSEPGMSLDSAKQQTRETLHQAKEQTMQKAGELADQAKSQLRSQLATQKDRATGSLGSVAHALHQTGEQLQGQDQALVGEYADALANQVERVSGYLRERSVDDVVRDTENLARQQPALFLGGTFVLGLLAARFLKSSQRSEDRYAGTRMNALAPIPVADTRMTESLEPVTPPPYVAANYVPGGVAGTGSQPGER